MSVVSKNPFELLGDDGEPRAASPAPKAAPAPAPAAKEQPKVVPGAAPKGGRGARYPSRGGPRNVYREERPADAGAEGFEGERVAPPKKDHQGRDRHTKGPREDRSHTGPRSRAPGAAGARGPKGQGRGGAKGGAAAAGGDKKPAPTESYDTAEGKAELTAADQGVADAAEAVAPAAEAEEVEVEEEDNSKTLDQYFAEKATLGGELAKKEARAVDADAVEGKVFQRGESESFFAGKKTAEKAPAAKEKAKKEKVFIEFDGQFASPARPPRTNTERPARGRGGRGGPRGAAPRGGARPAAARQAPVAVNDETAFPSLGSK